VKEDDATATDADPLDPFVHDFLRRLEEGEVDLEAFCAAAPAELRDGLRARCADLVILTKVLPGAIGSRPAATPKPGHRIGDFELVRELGRGAMGEVHLARQVSLQRLVAVKVLYPHLLASERALERFRREAKAAARLQHPGIVPVHSVGEDGGLAYFVMEFVDGRSLQSELESLRERRRTGAAPSPKDRLGADPTKSYVAQVAEIVAAVADALDYAHSQRVIHRDVKPHNILIGPGGRPSLVDFGLAKDLGEPSLSRSGDIAGTPYYMSPEQALARRVAIDHRTDVYSLGVVLYELLSLRRPFDGQSSQQVLFQISFQDPPPLRKVAPNIPRDLETICLEAMEKEPERRYATAGAMAADLRRFLAYESIVARPPSLLERAGRGLARHRAAAIGVGATLLVAALALAWQSRTERRRNVARELASLAAVPLEAEIERQDYRALRRDLDHAERIEKLGIRAGLEPETYELATTMARRILEFARERRSDGLQRLERVRTGIEEARAADPLVEWVPCPDAVRGDAESAIEQLSRAALLLPQDVELREITDLPRVTVRGRIEGARVFARRLEPDGSVGPPVLLGSTPLVRVPIRTGYYRIVVEHPSHGFAELTRLLQLPRHEYVLDPRLRTVDQVRAGMVRIEAAELLCHHPSHADSALLPRTVAESFWIDEAETSNELYREFLRDTGRTTPSWWQKPDDVSDEEWNRRPVAMLRWSEAIEFAEWAGKRLPDALEWQLAARGTDGRRYPWPGDDPSRLESAASFGHEDPGLGPLRYYLSFAEPVLDRPEGRGPNGLWRALDNVSEWTETLQCFGEQSEASFDFGRPMHMGGAFRDDASDVHLGSMSGIKANARNPCIGLRMAKSARD
jgi:formylglycine-generating enzyme required for sulfatase activity